MVALLFGNKSAMVRPMVSLWSLWSGRGGLLGKRSDHSDHGLTTIGVTIALLLPNKRVTIVTIALFWVLARGARDTGQNGTKRDIWSKWDKIEKVEPFLPPPMGFLKRLLDRHRHD